MGYGSKYRINSLHIVCNCMMFYICSLLSTQFLIVLPVNNRPLVDNSASGLFF